MIIRKSTRLGVALMLVGSMTGCAGTWPMGSTAQKQPQFDADSSAAKLVEAQRQTEQENAPASGLGAAWSGAKEAVASAMTIEPRVKKATDPLSLSNQPDSVSPNVFLKGGAYFESQGQLERAHEQYARALQAEPDQLIALISLARLSDRQGNSVEAEAYYQRAIAAHRQSALAYNDLGLFYIRKGQAGKAVSALQQAVALEPDNVRYGNNYAAALVEIGQHERALEQLGRTASPAEAHYNLAYLLYRNDNHQLARQHLAEALRQNPRMHEAQLMLARLDASDSGQHRQAQAYQAFERSPSELGGNATPHLNHPQQGAMSTPDNFFSPSTGRYRSAGADSEYQQAGAYTAERPRLQHLPPVVDR